MDKDEGKITCYGDYCLMLYKDNISGLWRNAEVDRPDREPDKFYPGRPAINTEDIIQIPTTDVAIWYGDGKSHSVDGLVAVVENTFNTKLKKLDEE